jgi:hypothetical protein
MKVIEGGEVNSESGGALYVEKVLVKAPRPRKERAINHVLALRDWVIIVHNVEAQIQ